MDLFRTPEQSISLVFWSSSWLRLLASLSDFDPLTGHPRRSGLLSIRLCGFKFLDATLRFQLAAFDSLRQLIGFCFASDAFLGTRDGSRDILSSLDGFDMGTEVVEMRRAWRE